MHWKNCATDFRLTFSDLEPLDGDTARAFRRVHLEKQGVCGTHVLLNTRHGSKANGEWIPRMKKQRPNMKNRRNGSVVASMLCCKTSISRDDLDVLIHVFDRKMPREHHGQITPLQRLVWGVAPNLPCLITTNNNGFRRICYFLLSPFISLQRIVEVLIIILIIQNNNLRKVDYNNVILFELYTKQVK